MNRRLRMELNRMVQLGLGRGEKSELLDKDVEECNTILLAMQETCQTYMKKLKEGIPNYAAGDAQKRQKKLPEYIFAQAIKDLAKRLSEHYADNLNKLLTSLVEIDELLAKEQISYEVQVDEHVIKPLTDLDGEYKKIASRRKELKNKSEEMDAAKRKYNSAIRQSSVPTETNAAKIQQMKDELDEITKQAEHLRDVLKTEIFVMMSREGEMSDILMKHIQLKTDYHRQALRIFESLQPEMQSIHDTTVRPVFHTVLRDDLRRTRRKIASVLEFCAVYLYQNSLNEEGLFRVAGSTSKVKMMKAVFDMGNDTPVQSTVISEADHHNVASTLKSYLRELPDPLTCGVLYSEWMSAIKVEDPDERSKALTRVISKLPAENYDNLSYLVKFLAAVASRSDRNKMTPSNLAIVMSPNLFWDTDADRTGFDMAATNLQHAIVETLITNQKDFFPGDFDPSPSTSTNSKFLSAKDTSSLDLSGGSESGGSPRPTTPPDHPPSPKPPPKSTAPAKTKKAPAPPNIPRRTENLPTTPDTTAPRPVPAEPTPPPSASAPKAERPEISKLYPDISQYADDPSPPVLAGLEPTVHPVAYSPSISITTHPEFGVAKDYGVPKTAPSPLPATRRKNTSGSDATRPGSSAGMAPLVRMSSGDAISDKEYKTTVKSGVVQQQGSVEEKTSSLTSTAKIQLQSPSGGRAIDVVDGRDYVGKESASGSDNGPPSINGYDGENGAKTGKPPLPPKRNFTESSYL